MPLWLRKLRRIGKWTGRVLVVSALCAWPATRWFGAVVRTPYDLRIMAAQGVLVVTFHERGMWPLDWNVSVVSEVSGPDQHRPFIWWFGAAGPGNTGAVWIPIWFIVVVLALPTAWLWRGDRRKPGQCPACDYDLRGLASEAICPECGIRAHAS